MTMPSTEQVSRSELLRARFLKLCEVTTPHGYECYCWSLIPGNWYLDNKDNLHVLIKTAEGKLPTTMFSSHLDTASYDCDVVNIIEEEGFVKTDGSSILGADCKIGVALMCGMIDAQVPGWYVFHVGEERGCIGSDWLSDRVEEWDCMPLRCVAFDRRDYDSIVTHQMGERCCSEEFALALAEALKEPGIIEMVPDPSGSYTDSYSYIGQIPECTNVSVGYFNQHSNNEKQNLDWACILLEKLILVDWENLPTKRDPTVTEYESFGGYGGWGRGGYGFRNHQSSPTLVSINENSVGLVECDECNHLQYIPVNDEFSFCETCGYPLDPEDAI